MDQDILTTLNLLIMGNSNVGKSSMLLRFTKDEFDENPYITMGPERETKRITINGNTVKLNISDTGGARRFRTIALSSIPPNSQGAILVFDVTDRESFTDLESWVHDFNRICEKKDTVKMVKMVVGNRIDLLNRREVTREEGLEFARRHQALYTETSAKTAYGVECCFVQLAQKILQTPGLWKKNPALIYGNDTATGVAKIAGDVKEGENDKAVVTTKFRCCAQQKSTGISVCIICNALYHSSCSGRLKNLQKVDNLFVICCLTSKQNATEYGSEAEESELVLTRRKVMASLKSQVAKYKSLADEKINENENIDGCIGCDRLKGEKNLLRELIKEVKDKNQLLEEKNANLCDNTNPLGANNVLIRYSDVVLRVTNYIFNGITHLITHNLIIIPWYAKSVGKKCYNYLGNRNK